MDARKHNADAVTAASTARILPSPEDGEKLFVRAIELRPDATGRKRLTLIVDVAPAPR